MRKFDVINGDWRRSSLTLKEVIESASYTDEEVEKIADLQTGKSVEFDGIKITRLR